MEQRLKEPEAVAAAAESTGSGGTCGAGVAGAQEASSEDRITLLLKLRAQTKQQLLEYKSMVSANEEKTPEQIMQEKHIEAKIEELENEIEDVKLAFEIKSLALDRMRLSTALKKSLEKMDTKSSVLTDDMKHILKLNKLIMESQQESRELEGKLRDIRKKRLQLKQASQSKLFEIQSEKNKQKEDLDRMENSDKIKNMEKNLQREIQITTVIQNVFQGFSMADCFRSGLPGPFDYAKAFDCVDHNKLWITLRKMGIPEHLIVLMRNLYMNQEAVVRIEQGNTEWFKVEKGVRQGNNNNNKNLIWGSKANWAEDSALKEIVLQLEKNLTML